MRVLKLPLMEDVYAHCPAFGRLGEAALAAVE